MNGDVDARMMGLALAASRKGRTAPNPHVGAVIAIGEEVIAVGHHERAGQAHAEIVALRIAGERARGATLYCTLEPCNHHGRTPPCTEAIVTAGIARVVIGCADPAQHGTPSGATHLTNAGLEVSIGVREDEALEIIEDFACLVQKKRPLVIIKAAVTLDGRIAARGGDSKWITGIEARREAHRLRDRADAVMVGVGTVLADDPSLDVRLIPGRNPVRVVLDSELRTPLSAKLVSSSTSQATWLVHGVHASADRRAALSAAGVVLIEAPLVDGSIDLNWTLRELGRRDIMRLLVEGGARVHGTLLERGLGDRAEIFVAPLILGDREGKPLADVSSPPQRIEDAFRLMDLEIDTLGCDVRFRGRIQRPHAQDAQKE